MPLNTRAGSAEAPIEPGPRTLCEPCETGPREKLWRLIVPAKPLPFETPGHLDALSGLEDRVDLDLRAHLQLARLAAELAQVTEVAHACLLQQPELRLVEAPLGRLAERKLHGVVAVALGAADAGDEAGTGLDHGHALDSAVLGAEDLGHAHFSSEETGHRLNQLNLDVDPRRQVIEPLQ